MNQSYVYLLKQDDEIVYVGQTAMLDGVATRAKDHKRDKVFNSVSSIKVNQEDMLRLETQMIVEHRPIYNKKIALVDLYRTIPWIGKEVAKTVSEEVYRVVMKNIQSSKHYQDGIIKIGRYEYCDVESSSLVIDSILDSGLIETIKSNILKSLNNNAF
jgi:hypothetical protein